MSAPLAGLTVLDLSRVLAGPWSTMTLADLGADVIKVENPKGGDDTRLYRPPEVGGESGYYLSCNRSKRSIALDFSKHEGQEILRALAKRSDVLVENYRFGTLERYGLDFETLSELNPQLIYCSISGYGRESPLAERAGYDTIIQAESGIMSVTGETGGGPVKVGMSISDIVAGMNATQAILSAIIARNNSNRGQYIDLSLHDCSVNLLSTFCVNYFIDGTIPARFGTEHPNLVPCQAFETSDCKIAIVIGNDRQFAQLCQAIGQESLCEDERYRTNGNRIVHRKSLIPLLENVFQSQTGEYWLERIRAAGLPAGAIRNVEEVLSSPEVKERGLLHTVDHPTAGKIRLVGTPLKFSDMPTVPPTAPPLLGEHTNEILRENLGYSDDEVERLRSKGIVGAKPSSMTHQ